MELGTIKQLSKNEGNLLFENAWTIILNADFVSGTLCLLNVYPNLRQYPGLFTGIQ